MRKIKLVIFCLYIFTLANVTACGGGSTSGTETATEKNELPSSQELNAAPHNIHDNSLSNGLVMMLAGTQKNVDLSHLNIESEIQEVEYNSDLLSIEIYENSLNIQAVQSESFFVETLHFVLLDQEGNTSTKDIEVGIFPAENNSLGWSLQGQHSNEYVNLVVVGDGYREEDRLKFYQDVQEFIDAMEEDEGVGPYMSRWAVHGIFTASIDAGIDDSREENNRRNYFDSYYNCAGIGRLICTDTSLAYDVALAEYADFDTLVMIINDERYGGAGGNISVFSAGHAHIALHELGHTFAGLADEYVDENLSNRYSSDDYQEGTFPNISASNDPNHVPWAHWVGDHNVGVYEGGLYNATGFYRPEMTSIMRSTRQPFGYVNSEVWVNNIYQIIGPILSVSPADTDVRVDSGSEVNFSLDLPYGFPIQSVHWYLDGQLLDEHNNESSVDVMLLSGEYQLTAKVDDLLSVRRWDVSVQKREHSWRIRVVN